MFTRPTVEYIDKMGDDCTVVNAARVSFDKHHEMFDYDTDRGLIKYLAKHDHWSPFAHTAIQFRVKAPIFVARQLGKHQVGLVWNEVSRRYVDSPPEFYLPASWRGKPVSAKQGSSEEIINISDPWVKDYIENCVEMYEILLDKGVAPEQARMVLPQNMMTMWYWTGSLLAFARICNQRMKVNAQTETRAIADKFWYFGQTHFPYSWNALMSPEVTLQTEEEMLA